MEDFFPAEDTKQNANNTRGNANKTQKDAGVNEKARYVKLDFHVIEIECLLESSIGTRLHRRFNAVIRFTESTNIMSI